MGVFHEQAQVVVRTPWPLTVQFDGQQVTLLPDYEWIDGEPIRNDHRNYVPTVVVPYALNQNPVMGSHDPDNPSVSGAQYLLGIVGKERKYPIDPLTAEEIAAQTNNPCRFDYMPLMEHRLGKRDKVEIKGRKKNSGYVERHAVSFEAGGND